MNDKVILEDVEKSTSRNSFGCAMLYVAFEELAEVQSLIDPNDVYNEVNDQSYGFEDEPHITLLYGFKRNVTADDIEEVTDMFTYFTCKLSNPSLFSSEKYDVLKFDVVGDNLKETNKQLKQLKHKPTHPIYHPHLTVAYLKAGMGEKYVKLLKSKKLDKFWVAPQFVVFSTYDEKKYKIHIRVD